MPLLEKPAALVGDIAKKAQEKKYLQRILVAVTGTASFSGFSDKH
jgi:hypothetical protein